MKRTLVVMVIGLACALAPRLARADHGERPDTENLVAAGALMAVPTYFLGVVLHEGSHAIMAKAFGRELLRFQIWPGRHPRNGRFYFGYVSYRPRLPPGKRTVFLVAPKLVDTVLLGAYAALVASDTLPENHYGQLALAVVATGLWVDFSKDLLGFFRPHDVNVTLDDHGVRGGWAKLPYYAVWAGLAAAGSLAILEGYQRVFDDGDPATARVVPLMIGRF